MYSEEINLHYEMPDHKGKLCDPSCKFCDKNEVCGDKVEVFLKIKENKIIDAKFDGKGCMISMASSDILVDKFIGSHIKEVIEYENEDVPELLGIELGVNRIKCATLPLKAMKRAIIDCDKIDLD
ncbi:MAG: iron-sulfur cluster assembly scaffold protein [Candidatus Woesearchaeota archaeon]